MQRLFHKSFQGNFLYVCVQAAHRPKKKKKRKKRKHKQSRKTTSSNMDIRTEIESEHEKSGVSELQETGRIPSETLTDGPTRETEDPIDEEAMESETEQAAMEHKMEETKIDDDVDSDNNDNSNVDNVNIDNYNPESPVETSNQENVDESVGEDEGDAACSDDGNNERYHRTEHKDSMQIPLSLRSLATGTIAPRTKSGYSQSMISFSDSNSGGSDGEGSYLSDNGDKDWKFSASRKKERQLPAITTIDLSSLNDDFKQGQNISSSKSNVRKPDLGVYQFDSDDAPESPPQKSKRVIVVSRPFGKATKKRKVTKKVAAKKTKPKINTFRIEAGKPLSTFLRTHPQLKDISLSRGKRNVKRHLVTREREDHNVDTGIWKRGERVQERNRVDDLFCTTAEGKKTQELIRKTLHRDEYVVAWYLWCPGHGNCLRKCGGHGSCAPGESNSILK